MIGTVTVAVALVAVIGWALRLYFNSRYDYTGETNYYVSWREFAIGVAVFGLVAGSIIVAIGNKCFCRLNANEVGPVKYLLF